MRLAGYAGQEWSNPRPSRSPSRPAEAIVLLSRAKQRRVVLSLSFKEPRRISRPVAKSQKPIVSRFSPTAATPTAATVLPSGAKPRQLASGPAKWGRICRISLPLATSHSLNVSSSFHETIVENAAVGAYAKD